MSDEDPPFPEADPLLDEDPLSADDPPFPEEDPLPDADPLSDADPPLPDELPLPLPPSPFPWARTGAAIPRIRHPRMMSTKPFRIMPVSCGSATGGIAGGTAFTI
jgi:hypothetical protein